MAGVLISIPIKGNFFFCWFWNPLMPILYKNARNVRFVLFRKNWNGEAWSQQCARIKSVVLLVLWIVSRDREHKLKTSALICTARGKLDTLRPELRCIERFLLLQRKIMSPFSPPHFSLESIQFFANSPHDMSVLFAKPSIQLSSSHVNVF